MTRDHAVNASQGMSEECALELLRSAIGVPGLPMKLRQIVPWDAEANVASRLSEGRVFLAGGVQDAHISRGSSRWS